MSNVVLMHRAMVRETTPLHHLKAGREKFIRVRMKQDGVVRRVNVSDQVFIARSQLLRNAMGKLRTGEGPSLVYVSSNSLPRVSAHMPLVGVVSLTPPRLFRITLVSPLPVGVCRHLLLIIPVASSPLVGVGPQQSVA